MLNGTSTTQVSSLAVPATQNTAPVHEFNCLYTRDIKRKSKRWQDGFLRFHTFNKRVMVYDVPRNFIGDTHWTVDDLLQDGDEVTLDRSGVLVQVADQIGRSETDLTEIRKSKKKPASVPTSTLVGCVPSGGVAVAIQRTSTLPSSSSIQSFQPRQPLQDKHRSLNALLGAERSPLGKSRAFLESPYEERLRREAESETLAQRPLKRQRLAHIHQVSPHDAKSVSAKRKQDRAQPSTKQNSLDIVDLSSDPFSQDVDEVGFHHPPQITTSTTDDVSGLKLSIRASTAKRKMLVCLPEHYHQSLGPDDGVQQATMQREQARLNARLAKLSERSARHRDPQPRAVKASNTRSREEASMPQVLTTMTSSTAVVDRARVGDIVVLNADTQISEEDAVSRTGVGTRLYSRTANGNNRIDRENAGKSWIRPTSEAFSNGRVELNGQELANEQRPTAQLDLQLHDETSATDLEADVGVSANAHNRTDSTVQTVPGISVEAEIPHQLKPATEEIGSPVRVPDEEEASAIDYSGPAHKTLLTSKAIHQQQNPWSREAFDLFTWRPPDWDEEQWCVASG